MYLNYTDKSYCLPLFWCPGLFFALVLYSPERNLSYQMLEVSYLFPVLLRFPSCLALVVQCEPESPAPVLKKPTQKGEDEVKPQRVRYVMERLIEDYFEEERGEKRRRRD